MPNTSTTHQNKSISYYLIALAVLIFDQISKYYFESILNIGESIDVINPVLNWTLAYNHGAAFSFMADQGGWQKWFFVILGLVVAGYIINHLRKIAHTAKLLAFGLALVLGGAIGNVLDRILHGHVIDFIHVHYADVWHYPIFNIADIGICVGMALVVYDMLFLEKKRQAKS
ncbi:signal peptidase II [Moraxella marmotae]|uniref:signal peptidase II n=1 Tax=Moraxella marmotae TaxID=3344520 RepID=UPI0035F449C0